MALLENGRCDGWLSEDAVEMKELSSGHVSPVSTVRWLSGGSGTIWIGEGKAMRIWENTKGQEMSVED